VNPNRLQLFGLRRLFAVTLVGAGWISSCYASARVIPLAQGADTTFVVTIGNATSSDIPLAVFGGMSLFSPGQTEYSVVVLNPGVCSVGFGTLPGTIFRSFDLSGGPVPAHGSVVCSIQIHRDALSHHALEAGFQPFNMPPGVTLSDTEWYIGPIADLSIKARQVDPFPRLGQQVGFTRITIRNRGPWDVQHADFGYCQDSVFAPFTLDNNLPNGCGAAYYGPACFATGLPSVQFGVGSLAAGQTKSCLLRVTANEPLTTTIGFPLGFVSEPVSLNYERPVDPYTYDNMTDLEIAPLAVVPVPAGSELWLILPVLLVLSGWLARVASLTKRRY